MTKLPWIYHFLNMRVGSVVLPKGCLETAGRSLLSDWVEWCIWWVSCMFPWCRFKESLFNVSNLSVILAPKLTLNTKNSVLLLHLSITFYYFCNILWSWIEKYTKNQTTKIFKTFSSERCFKSSETKKNVGKSFDCCGFMLHMYIRFFFLIKSTLVLFSSFSFFVALPLP